MAEVPELKLNTGTAMPAIGFGTWKLSQGHETVEAVKNALKAGYRLIDTAKLYANEQSVGDAVRSSGVNREEIFVTTKLWGRDMGYESAIEAFEASAETLGIDYLDLYLIHWPGDDAKLRKDSWRALTQLQNEGQVKAVGVSNYEVEDLEELLSDSSLVPAVNQIEFHPFIFDEQQPILEFCKEQGIVVEAYSPLARAHQLDHPTIKKIADKVAKSSAQVLLRWAVQHGTVPIPKSSQPERIKENIDIFDFELSDADMEAINSLSNGQSVIRG